MSNNKKLWVSRVFAGFVTAALAATATMKIVGAPKMVEGITHVGIPLGAIVPIALVELACLALYLIPRTAILGAVLLTGYFGGAIVVHIIGKESIFPLIMIGISVWGGVYFRFPVIQGLMPFLKELQFARSADPAFRRDAPRGRSASPSHT